MQYKIPVQIENEDTIIFNLSLRQIMIIVSWFAISSMVFNSLTGNWVPNQIALLPSWVIFFLAFAVAVVKLYHMSFLPFIIAFSRHIVNTPPRYWVKWADSFQPIDIWYVQLGIDQERTEYTTQKNHERLASLEESLNKI